MMSVCNDAYHWTFLSCIYKEHLDYVKKMSAKLKSVTYLSFYVFQKNVEYHVPHP